MKTMTEEATVKLESKSSYYLRSHSPNYYVNNRVLKLVECKLEPDSGSDDVKEGKKRHNVNRAKKPRIRLKDKGKEPSKRETEAKPKKKKLSKPIKGTQNEEEGHKIGAQKRLPKKLPCVVCNRLFTNVYMTVHLRSHTGEKPFRCQNCEKQFSSQQYLNMHIRRCHGDPDVFKCEVCFRSLASRGSLKQHLRTHSTEKPFRCEMCGKSFKQPSLLSNHVKIHDDTLSYQCEKCGNQYKSIQGLLRHRERIHEGIRHSFPCELCDKAFTRRTKLKDHLLWHRGASPYVCSYCGKKLLSRKTLRTHILIHENKKPYVCSVCGKAFRQNCVLKRHLTIHTGIKPFRCELCGKQFIHRTYLVKHKCSLQMEYY